MKSHVLAAMLLALPDLEVVAKDSTDGNNKEYQAFDVPVVGLHVSDDGTELHLTDQWGCP